MKIKLKNKNLEKSENKEYIKTFHGDLETIMKIVKGYLSSDTDDKEEGKKEAK